MFDASSMSKTISNSNLASQGNATADIKNNEDTTIKIKDAVLETIDEVEDQSNTAINTVKSVETLHYHFSSRNDP